MVNIAGRALVLHVADLDLVRDNPYGPSEPANCDS